MPSGGPGQSSAKASRDTGIAPRERRVRTARGWVSTVIGVDGRRRSDTCGVAWRPPLRERGLTIFRRYFCVHKPRRTGLRPAACTPAGYAADVYLVPRQAWFAGRKLTLPHRPRVVFAIEIRKRRRLRRRPSSGGMRAYRSGGASTASKPLMIIPAGRGVSGQGLCELIVVRRAHP